MWKRKGMRYVFLDQAGDGTGGGAGGDGGSSAGAAGSADSGAGSQSVLASGGEGQGASSFIPEKFQVKTAEGSLDVEASSRKMADAYGELSKRLGAGGETPPKTPEEYAPKVEAEGFNWDEQKNDPSMQGFLKGAHAKGITNDQLGYVLGEYFKTAPQLVQGAAQLDSEAATAELKKVWTTDADMKANVGLAFKAFNAFADEADRARIDEIGNNPMVIRMLARIGKEMQEDTPANGGQHIAPADFDTKVAELRDQIEKMPVSDPRRKALKDQLDGLYASRYGTKKQSLGFGTSRPSA